MSEISKNVKSYLFPKSQTSHNNDGFEEVSEQLIHDSELITLKEEAHKEGFNKDMSGNLKGFEQGTIQGNKKVIKKVMRTENKKLMQILMISFKFFTKLKKNYQAT